VNLCHPSGHIFKFYEGQSEGHCVYCGKRQNGLHPIPMSPKQYRAAIEALGLSQVKAGLFLGVGPRTSRRWALDESAIPESVAKLLRVMIHYKLTPEEVDKFAKK
jgi:hypothetical protein